MRFRFIRDHRETFTVGRMCDVLRVSRSGFYAWLTRPLSVRRTRDAELAREIREVHAKSRGTYGVPRVHAALRSLGYACGRKRVAHLMRQERLYSKARRKFRATTDSTHSLPVAPNVLAQNFEIGDLNQVWVADITYIPTGEGWLYLASIMDLCSRSIVGWSMASSMRSELVEDALRMAVGRRSPAGGLIHHSDRGSQYASRAYQQLLSENGIRCSMSRKGNCYDNAPCERFFWSLKKEWVNRLGYADLETARQSVFHYIEAFYNRVRRHQALGYISPAQFEANQAA